MKWSEMSITKIKEHIRDMEEPDPALVQELLQDPRKGVVDLGKQLEARIARRQRLAEQWQEMTVHERAMREKGMEIICGVDEVGRGPLAGPVVASAVVLPKDFYLPGLNDSKKLPPNVRQAMYEVIMRDAVAVGIGIVSSERIDSINILEATREAMTEAIRQLGIRPDICLIDAVSLPGLDIPQLPIIGGDAKSVSIAAASVVAKETRDRMMNEYALHYPQYGFDRNAGYGTAEHLQALEKYGPSPIHRRSFGMLKEEGN